MTGNTRIGKTAFYRIAAKGFDDAQHPIKKVALRIGPIVVNLDVIRARTKTFLSHSSGQASSIENLDIEAVLDKHRNSRIRICSDRQTQRRLPLAAAWFALCFKRSKNSIGKRLPMRWPAVAGIGKTDLPWMRREPHAARDLPPLSDLAIMSRLPGVGSASAARSARA